MMLRLYARIGAATTCGVRLQDRFFLNVETILSDLLLAP